MPAGRHGRRRTSAPVRVQPEASAPADRNQQSIVVMFADIIGCSEISNHKNLHQYNEFLKTFRDIFLDVTGTHRQHWYGQHESQYVTSSVRGDEGVLMTFIPGRKPADLAADIDTAVYVALDLKRRWLLSTDNRDRILDIGLMPTGLAIGIHLGKAYINEDDADGSLRPEGYAINLTKRIESESRSGLFTHIFLSEAARGQLQLLTDEVTYTFAEPHTFRPKGISRDVCAFEVKHHFLPADWTHSLRLKSHSGVSKAINIDVDGDAVRLAGQAYRENPTNLWLAEEYIVLSMLYDYQQLVDQGKEDEAESLREAFSEAEEVGRRLSLSEQRDAGVLAVRGLIAGEQGDYALEQDLYDQALKEDSLYPEIYWYKASSMSAQVRDELDDPSPKSIEVLNDAQRATIAEVKSQLRKAIDLNRHHAWFRFDLACELGAFRSSDADYEEGVDQLIRAIQLNSAVKEAITDGEEDLADIAADKRVLKLLKTLG